MFTCRKRYAAYVQAGIDEGHRPEFHHGGEDGRVLAGDRFLEQVLGKRVDASPEVSLDEILACVSAEYGVSAEDLRGPSRNRVVSEARAVIGWLSRRLRADSIRVWRHIFNATLRRSVDTLEASITKQGIQINFEPGSTGTLIQ